MYTYEFYNHTYTHRNYIIIYIYIHMNFIIIYIYIYTHTNSIINYIYIYELYNHIYIGLSENNVASNPLVNPHYHY